MYSIAQFNEDGQGLREYSTAGGAGNIAAMSLRSLSLLGVALAAAAFAAPASAFVFSDGKSASCMVRGATIREYEAPATDPLVRDRTGITTPEGASYAIVWNGDKLRKLPPTVHDFIFFHECAHARVPTSVEVTANCEGLKEMRAAGRAGPAVEALLAQFFGNSSYWQDTLKCANRVIDPTPAGPIRLAPPSKPAG